MNNRRPTPHRRTNSPPHASPPTTNVDKSPNTISGTVAKAAGGIKQCVIPSPASTPPNASPPNTPTGHTTNAAPEPKAHTISKTDASKLGDANCNTRSPGPAPNRDTNPAAKFPTPACVTTTPFGRPVDPDV
ncbi:hypothetical protein GCM10022226_68590 [Sphaerisporangium flaviroseum]|uniref:Uncharacterized protein n=1 Tax=Sphaerisporangium flaviroseum TaxID=509199 RepID=A0ABP7J7U2_9ACTN